MFRYIARMSIASLVLIAPLAHAQTPAPTNTIRQTNATVARPLKQKVPGTNVVGRSTNFVSRVHARITKESEPEFIRLINGRKTIMDDIRSIRRLIREKQAALERIDALLASDYSINKDRNYKYDVPTRTISEVSNGAQGTNGVIKAESAPGDAVRSSDKKRVHMVLDSAEKADKFVQLTSAKQLDSTMIRVLALLEQEKNGDLSRLNSILLEKFGMSRDRGYEYDSKTGTLYELIPVPATGKGESQQQH